MLAFVMSAANDQNFFYTLIFQTFKQDSLSDHSCYSRYDDFHFCYFLIRPNLNKLSAVAMMESSFDRGDQPNNSFALPPLACIYWPSRVATIFNSGFLNAAIRKTKFGISLVGTFFAS